LNQWIFCTVLNMYFHGILGCGKMGCSGTDLPNVPNVPYSKTLMGPVQEWGDGWGVY
jgi:hypothetical protein